MRSEWISYKGFRIFFCNYSNLDFDTLKKEMDEVDYFIGQQPEGSLLILTDVHGLIGSPQVIDLFKKSTKFTNKYIRKSAVIGIGFSGPKKVLFDIVMRFSGQNVTVFDEMEKAKEWLIKKENS